MGPFVPPGRPAAAPRRGRAFGRGGGARGPGRAWAVAAALLSVALAGCGDGGGPGADAVGPAATPLEILAGASQCQTAILFQFVDYSATDTFLPPGFHPRDPQAFLGAPVAVGQAAIVLANMACAASELEGGPLNHSFLGIFVETPVVPGETLPGGLDFYEVEHLAGPGATDRLLASLGWSLRRADVRVPASEAGAALVQAEVADASGVLYAVQGSAPVPYNFDLDRIRFWHQSPQGLGHFLIDAQLDARFGPGVCSLRADSTAARLSGATTCPTGETLVATFPGLSYDGWFRFLPGVEAQ